MLVKQGIFNDLTPGLRAELQKELESVLAGNKRKTIRYKFNIAKENPDPQKYNGPVIYPHIFTLPQKKFWVQETIKDKDNPKATPTIHRYQVALVKEVDKKDGSPTKFGKIQVHERDHGYLELNLQEHEDIEKFAYLEIHPRNGSGKFMDKNKPPIFFRIDEVKNAKEQLRLRKDRIEAQYLAHRWTDAEVREFAAAMTWDENEDMTILRNQTEQLAEQAPDMFLAAINDGLTKQKALVKKAFTQGVLSWIPIENKVTWANTNETIAVLDRVDGNGRDEVYRFADWLVSHKNGPAVEKKLKELVK